MSRRRIARAKERTMESVCDPDRGGTIVADAATSSRGPDGPDGPGRTLERPARLKQDAVVEAVSSAVLSQLEGGISLVGVGTVPIILGFIRPGPYSGSSKPIEQT
jgi:hypothetical protein